MTGQSNLTGHWTGAYVQHEQSRPISARIEQEGLVVIGTMSDQVTDFESSVSEIAMREALPPGADEEIVEQIRKLCPEAPLEPVKVMFHLPEDSDLEGEVNGQEVSLLKRYRGQHFAGYRVGHIRIGALGEGQQVAYRGRLNLEMTEIRGSWEVLGDDLSPFHRAHGDFVLRREDRESDPDSSLN